MRNNRAPQTAKRPYRPPHRKDMAAACYDANHYKGYQDKMKGLPNGFNAKAVDIIPKLGSDGMFGLKGKAPLLIRNFKFFKGKVIAVSWAPDSEDVMLKSRLVVGDQGGQVLIVDAKKGTRRGGYNLSGPSKFVQSCAIHAKKDLVVSGGMDNMISMYKEKEPGDPFLEFSKQWAGEGPLGHDGMISSLKWHPSNDNQFISAGGDGEVKIWDITGGNECLTTYYGHSEESTSITFPKDDQAFGGNVFGTCSNDTTTKLWDLRTCDHTASHSQPIHHC